MAQKGSIKCPDCGNLNAPRKQWYYGPKNDPKRMIVRNFHCVCGRKYHAWIRPTKVTVKFVDMGKGRPPKRRRKRMQG